MKRFYLFFLFLIILPFSVFSLDLYDGCKKINQEATRLKIIETSIEVYGQPSKVYEIIQEDGSKIIQKREGECFNLILENQTTVPTVLHWHGLILPCLDDGVAYVTQAPIPPGESYPYNFKIIQAGTYFAHSHYGLQEQKLMTIPLIFLPKEESPYRDVILSFEDFSFRSLDSIWQDLRKEFMKEAKIKGENWIPSFTPPPIEAPKDLNDVHYDAYLTNRRTLENPDIQLVKPGETIRLRFINASAASQFHVFLGKLGGKIIAVDGSPIVPAAFSEFPLATAQRTDVLVTIPAEGGVFPILAQAQGTNMITGIILMTEGEKIPRLSSRTRATIGSITNVFDRKIQALKPLQPRKIDRKLTVDLEGNMKYYVWAINNHVWPNMQPLLVKEGERVEITFINKTGMSHPMHFHGHVFQILEIDGNRFSGPLRDTVFVMPNQTVKVQFDANNPGIWAMHCHIAYHLWAGMFTVIKYEDFKPPYFSKQEVKDYSRIYGGY